MATQAKQDRAATPDTPPAPPSGAPARGPGPWILLILLAGLAIRLPGLDEPLLEGASGKQTHTAMVARNLHRGRGTWLRPMVDDIGPPGYFVKELPLVPLAAAAVYPLTGGPRDAVGRAIGVVAWLAALPLVIGLVARSRPRREALAAGVWFALAPIGIAYSRAFMSDAAMVAASLAALAATLAWRDRPGALRAAVAGAWTSLALLLKLHAFFWLAPALAVAALARSRRSADAAVAAAPTRPTPPALAVLALALLAGGAAAGAWYVHAAAIHRAFPVLGATVAQGWVHPALWLDPELYARVARQIFTMVFTPAGLLLAAVGLARRRAPLGLVERALVAWGAGVVLQSIFFGTRMFDDTARGTEYYQLALVPCAAWAIARGLGALAGAVGDRARPWALGAAWLVLAGGALHAVRPALAPPARYAGLLDTCREVRARTPANADILVIADRGGTVLYYCDRRGTTLTPASAISRAMAGVDTSVDAGFLARAVERATHVLVPFPDLVPPGVAAALATGWRREPIGGAGSELYVRETGAPPGASGAP